MSGRPALDTLTDSVKFREYYYLKKELIAFCRKHSLGTSGSKEELSERIAYFLDKGEVMDPSPKPVKRRREAIPLVITEHSIIEPDFVCSESHRTFFRKQIGSSFSFNVTFQKWLKANAGRTYRDAIDAYHQIVEDKKNKKGKTQIGKQFEYNAYIRDFFADNEEGSLQEAITCWKYKKNMKGHNRYERSDLCVLNQ